MVARGFARGFSALVARGFEGGFALGLVRESDLGFARVDLRGPVLDSTPEDRFFFFFCTLLLSVEYDLLSNV
jgi:hypothetical protein